MSDSLYQDALLKLAREAPRQGRLEPNDVSVRLDNPLCGDRVRLDLRMSGPKIAELAHEVRGCVLCQAAAGIVGLHAVGLDRAGVAALAADVDRVLSGQDPVCDALRSFAPVASHRSRHDCVLLPFQALKESMKGG
ncbi:MAG: iron-sulfur cluster assembly scaffold protein [Alphaproteobacteria bacterium]|nr:iron-sulfur cluster assembly scaffold protein [Alphaproteobacteria bacterium]